MRPWKAVTNTKLRVLWLLKKQDFISCPSDAHYLCCEGGDHIVGLADGRIVAVDLVLDKVVRINGVKQ